MQGDGVAAPDCRLQRKDSCHAEHRCCGLACAETARQIGQQRCRLIQPRAACAGILHHGRIVPVHLIQLGHARGDPGQGCGLILGAGGDARGQDGDTGDLRGDFRQRAACGADQRRSARHLLAAARDQGGDLFGRLCRFLGQGAHFGGDHGKAASFVTGARGLDPGIQRQQIGLKGDILDHIDHLRHLL